MDGVPNIVQWRPTPSSFNGLCVFTAAVDEASKLTAALEHNANWAVAHGSSFSLFRSHMARKGVDRQWEKVIAARHMLHRDECRWLMHMDADAVVVDVSRSPDALRRHLETDAAPAQPVVIATCNSPLGRGHSCDVLCCVRARDGDACCAREARKIRPQCAVGLHDVGLPKLSSSAPYPCMINSGVWFMKNAEEARILINEWEAKQSEHPEIFGEQASLNELKERHPHLIDIVGAQVMNTHSAFHKRMLRAGEVGRAAYDYALRTTSGYEPGVDGKCCDGKIDQNEVRRLNQTLYAEATLRMFGHPLNSQDLDQLLIGDVGECERDPSAFICHAYARPPHMKQALARKVAMSRRLKLDHLLEVHQHIRFRTLNEVVGAPEGSTPPQPSMGPRGRILALQNERRRREHSVSSSSSSAVSNSSHTGTAVCVAGSLRTFLQPIVQHAFMSALHHEGYEYFVATDTQQPKRRLLVHPIRAWISLEQSGPLHNGRPNTPERDLLPRGRCPRGTCNPFRFLLPFAQRLAECYYAIQREEGRRLQQYATVLRVRPDHVFLRRMPPVTPSGWVGAQLIRGRVLLWDDQMAVALRADAAAALLAPTVGYASCADEAEWTRATLAGRATSEAELSGTDWTMAKCRERGDIPCSAMALAVIVFGGATSWRHLPLKSKDWLPHTEAERQRLPAEDFCLKRELFTNETTDGRNGRNPDELGMACR